MLAILSPEISFTIVHQKITAAYSVSQFHRVRLRLDSYSSRRPKCGFRRYGCSTLCESTLGCRYGVQLLSHSEIVDTVPGALIAYIPGEIGFIIISEDESTVTVLWTDGDIQKRGKPDHDQSSIVWTP